MVGSAPSPETSNAPMASFSTADHLTEALEAYANPVNARVGEITRAAIKHLYAFAEEVGLTREEWFAGIGFLTAVGQMCDEQRQEFILMSDTLGFSMLIEMINQDAAEGTTDPTVFGPFHIADAAIKEMGESIVIDDQGGSPLTLSGTVRNLDGEPIEGAMLDVWQNAANGLYDVQDPDQTPMNMRGRFITAADGKFSYQTVRPIAYSVPFDGPVGAMLTANGRHAWRPAHTHMVVSADGYKPITTHLFDQESEYLDSDAVFGVRESLIVDMSQGVVNYDFVLEPN